jgi:hypothetical protein
MSAHHTQTEFDHRSIGGSISLFEQVPLNLSGERRLLYDKEKEAGVEPLRLVPQSA